VPGVGLARSPAALRKTSAGIGLTKFQGVLIGPERTLPCSFFSIKGAAKGRNGQREKLRVKVKTILGKS